MTSGIIISATAIVLIALSVSRFAVTGVSAMRMRARAGRMHYHSLLSLRGAAELARLSSELSMTRENSELPWRVMEVAEVVEESVDCRSFYLVDPYHQPLPDFAPGQYLMVRPALAGAFQATRCYSISSSPDPRFWRITIKRQSGVARDAKELPRNPNRGLSGWIHENIQTGDCLLIGGPAGQFHLDQECQAPIILLAAGVGITPMASMLRWSVERTPSRPVALFYQAKDFDHWPLGETLHRWEEGQEKLSIHSFFSRCDKAQIDEKFLALPGTGHAGKFSASDVRKSPEFSQAQFYMCGPDGWMEDLRSGLIGQGVPAERVHWESFGNAANERPAVAAGDQEFQIRFEQSGREVVWSDPEQSLWELAQQANVPINSGCLSGVCGACKVKVLEGEVAYDRKTAVELAADECLTCIARPQSNVRLDA